MPNRKRLLAIGALCYDNTYGLDRTLVTNEKRGSHRWEFAPGGCSIRTARAANALGLTVDLHATVGNDKNGEDFLEIARGQGINVHPRSTKRTPVNTVTAFPGHREIIKAPVQKPVEPFTMIDVRQFQWLHLDGNQGDCAMAHARAAGEHGGITVSLDGSVRDNTLALIRKAHVVICGKELGKKLGNSVGEALEGLRSMGVRIGGITDNDSGLQWYEGDSDVMHTPAFAVEELDGTGAGDTHFAGLIASKLMHPGKTMHEHTRFAAALAAMWVSLHCDEKHFATENEVHAFMRSQVRAVG